MGLCPPGPGEMDLALRIYEPLRERGACEQPQQGGVCTGRILHPPCLGLQSERPTAGVRGGDGIPRAARGRPGQGCQRGWRSGAEKWWRLWKPGMTLIHWGH